MWEVLAYVGCTVGWEIMTSCHQSHADGGEGHHQEEAFSSTPKVEDLGKGNEDSCIHTICHHPNNRNQRVRFPFAGSKRL